MDSHTSITFFAVRSCLQTQIIKNILLENPQVKLITDTKMKKLLLLVLMGITISCSTTKKYSSLLKEDEYYNTRKYIGNFVDYCHTSPEVFGGAHLIWFKTTLYSSYGKISAYSKECEFCPGDKLYLRRTCSTPGPFGNWSYQIENDSSVMYAVSEYRYENNVLARSWF
jgi:hypothetical protein